MFTGREFAVVDDLHSFAVEMSRVTVWLSLSKCRLAGVSLTRMCAGPRSELFVDHRVSPTNAIPLTRVTSSRSTACASIGQLGAEAQVRAEAECDVLARISVDPVHVGVVGHSSIAVRGAERQQHARVDRNRDIADG